MEAWPGTVAMGMERVDGCESFWWPVHRTLQGQLVCRNGEQTRNGHGGCVLAECLRAHLCLCGLGFQKQASAQDCPHCCDFYLQALCSLTHRKGPGSDPG